MTLETSETQADRQGNSRAVGGVAAFAALAAVGCGVCCVLPFALPAALLAMSGGVLAWFAEAHAWLTAAAVAAVLGAWTWTAAQTLRTRRRPARSTLLILVAATALLTLALAWPRLEALVAGWLGA